MLPLLPQPLAQCSYVILKPLIFYSSGTPVQNSSQQVLLPGVTSVISWADAADRANFNVFASIKEEASDLDTAYESSVEKEVKVQSVALPFEVGHHIIVVVLPVVVDFGA